MKVGLINSLQLNFFVLIEENPATNGWALSKSYRVLLATL